MEKVLPPKTGYKILLVLARTVETIVLIGCIGIVVLFFVTYAHWLFTSAPLNPTG